MILVFDMDGTLTEPWYGEKSPIFYQDEKDTVLRSLISNTYEYVKPLPYVEKFLESCNKYYKGKVQFKVLTRIMNGKEYMDKVKYIKKTFPNTNFEVYGAISEDDKIIYLESLGTNSKVIYFDDTVATICKANQVDNVFGVHSTSMLMHSIEDIDKAFELEKNYKPWKEG